VTSNGPTGAPGLNGGHFAAPDLWDTIIKDMGTDGVDPGVAAPVDNGVQPFSWQDEAGTNGLPNLEPFSLDSLPGDTASVPADLHDALPPLAPAASTPMSLDDAIATLAPAPVATAAIAVAALGRSSQASTSDLLLPEVEPFALSLEDVEGAPVLPIAPMVPAVPDIADKSDDKFVTADGRVDFTVGWDDLDRQLREATPSFDNAAEIDALAAELGVDGVVPFDVGENPFDDSAWAPFTDDDLGARAPAAPMAVPASDPVSAYVAGAAPGNGEPVLGGWDLDDELVSAIPAQQPTGYTEMLRHVDTELPLDVDSQGDVNPFANPDTSGDPLAFEDLLAVTSRDGTAPLAAPPEMFTSATSFGLGGDNDAHGPAFEAGVAIGSDETLIDAVDVPADIDPFTFTEAPVEPMDLAALADANEPAWFVDRAPETGAAAADVPLDENPLALEVLLRGIRSLLVRAQASLRRQCSTRHSRRIRSRQCFRPNGRCKPMLPSIPVRSVSRTRWSLLSRQLRKSRCSARVATTHSRRPSKNWAISSRSRSMRPCPSIPLPKRPTWSTSPTSTRRRSTRSRCRR